MKPRISTYDEARVIIVTLRCSIRLTSSLLYCSCVTELNLFIMVFHTVISLAALAAQHRSAWHSQSSSTCVAFSSAMRQRLLSFAVSIQENPKKIIHSSPHTVLLLKQAVLRWSQRDVNSWKQHVRWNNMSPWDWSFLHKVIRPYLLQWSRNSSLL